MAVPTMADAIDTVRAETRRRFGDFIMTRVNPGARFRNRDGVPLDFGLFREASELGVLQLSLPPEIGGGGRDKLEWGVTIAELARMCADPGFPVLLDITVENTELLLSSGRSDLIAKYVPDLVAGRRFAVQAAYESRDPYDYETTARLSDGEWVLNGAKRFIAGAVFANLFIVYLRDEASNDMLAFLVEPDDAGVSALPLDTMGLRSMGLGQLVLEDVRLPESRLIWRADALSELNGYARGRRLMTACGAVGAMEGIVERCVESLGARIRGGRRVLDYPNVERSVGEMRVLVESARSIVYRALDNARRQDRDPYFDELATAAKHHVSECAVRVGQLVMNLQGGESYIASFGWEQFMRDILGLIGGQGSQELLLIQLGQRSIVNLEGRQLRREAAERTVAKLADASWAAAAAKASEDGVEAFAAFTTAFDNGLLAAFTEPRRPAQAAEQAGLPPECADPLVRRLARVGILREIGAGRYRLDPGLDSVLSGGPRASAFRSRLDGALRGAALLDVMAGHVFGRLEGLDALLRDGRVGCAAADGGQSAAALARYLPSARVVPLDAGKLALAWVDAPGLTRDELPAAVETATEATVPGGWVVVVAALPARDGLGGDPTTGADAEEALRRAGCRTVRRLAADPGLGLELIAGRAPTRSK